MRKDRISCSRAKNFLNLFIFGGFFIFPILLSAAQNDVVINEIAWMGTAISANDEWLELKNNTSQEIDLTGWTLKAIDGTPKISLTGIIPAQGYFLLERTDDDSMPNIIADQIYTGALGNSGENLELRDAQNNLIDSVNCSETWPAGDNLTEQTMERITGGWQTSSAAGGTPKAINSSGATATSSEPSTPPDQETSAG
ncbi:MAG: lamin tail domain-containing protein, partial [Patescibacteria group bacterium]